MLELDFLHFPPSGLPGHLPPVEHSTDPQSRRRRSRSRQTKKSTSIRREKAAEKISGQLVEEWGLGGKVIGARAVLHFPWIEQAHSSSGEEWRPPPPPGLVSKFSRKHSQVYFSFRLKSNVFSLSTTKRLFKHKSSGREAWE